MPPSVSVGAELMNVKIAGDVDDLLRAGRVPRKRVQVDVCYVGSPGRRREVCVVPRLTFAVPELMDVVVVARERNLCADACGPLIALRVPDSEWERNVGLVRRPWEESLRLGEVRRV